MPTPPGQCSSVDSNPWDDVSPTYCGYNTLGQAFAACAAKGGGIGGGGPDSTQSPVGKCDCRLLDSQTIQLCCSNSCQFGVSPPYTAYYFEFPAPTGVDFSQSVELLAVNLLFVLGVVAGLLTVGLFGRG